MIYKCECGKEFDNPQQFNGHKAHCVQHLEATGKIDSYNYRKQIYKNTLSKNRAKTNQKLSIVKYNTNKAWLNERHTCERCGKVMTERYGSGRFCSRKCANSRINVSKQTLIATYIKHAKEDSESKFVVINEKLYNKKLYEDYMLSPKICSVCGSTLSYENRNRKTCSKKCASISSSITQQKNPHPGPKRSKNEILFYTLCTEVFDKVLHNEPIFNGWDADIILPDIKYAILWNGSWHYEQIVKGQSLLQIQTRDRLKLDAIKQCGYTAYVIKDMGGYNPRFVKEQFEIFLSTVIDNKTS